jgi:hypothetical protein
MIRPSYQEVLRRVREAYEAVRQGRLRAPVWKHEGASSYTVSRPDPVDQPSTGSHVWV